MLTRAETPTQSLSRALYWAGTAASVVASTGDSSPFSSSRASGGVFSVKNTSAGDCEPSCSICWASTSSSSLRTLTFTPVCFSNALTSASVVCSCWPLYSVIVCPASDDAEADPAAAGCPLESAAAGWLDALPPLLPQAAISRAAAVPAAMDIHLVSLMRPHFAIRLKLG